MRPDHGYTRFSTLIVDDEPLARQGLRLLLAEHPGVESISEANNGPEAMSLITSQRPDIVFLDVQMPEMDGFAVVREVGPEHMPAVVFVTAHDRYALRAFEINAIDYLLKPVVRERFTQALARVQGRLRHTDEVERRLVSLLEALSRPSRYLSRIAIRSAGKTSFVSVEDVHWFQAAENYVRLHMSASRHFLHVPISTLQSSLDPGMFMRIHRSTIVNLRQVKDVEFPRGEYTFVLHSGARLQSSRTYHDAIKTWASNPF